MVHQTPTNFSTLSTFVLLSFGSTAGIKCINNIPKAWKESHGLLSVNTACNRYKSAVWRILYLLFMIFALSQGRKLLKAKHHIYNNQQTNLQSKHCLLIHNTYGLQTPVQQLTPYL